MPTLLAGLVIVYSFLLMLSTLSFWFVKLDNVLVIFQALFHHAGRWPVTIFPVWMKFALTFVVPVAFAVTVPGPGADAADLPGRGPPVARRRRHVPGGVSPVLALGVAPLHRRLGVLPPVRVDHPGHRLQVVAELVGQQGDVAEPGEGVRLAAVVAGGRPVDGLVSGAVVGRRTLLVEPAARRGDDRPGRP